MRPYPGDDVVRLISGAFADLFAIAGRPLGGAVGIWVGRTVYDIADGLSPQASFAKHAAEAVAALAFTGPLPAPPLGSGAAGDNGVRIAAYCGDACVDTIATGVVDLYAQTGRPLDIGFAIWVGRAVYDTAAGFSCAAAKQKHLAELSRALGIGVAHVDPPLGPPVPPDGLAARHRAAGVVRVQDRVFVDETGPFRPLGATLFWALWGWTNDRDRVKKSLGFLAARGIEFVRILGDVGWENQEIDSTAADYESILASVIDTCFDTHGMRVELTLWGGSRRDPVAAAARAARVITAGRQHKILDIEAGNESFQNGPDDATIGRMLSILNGTGCLTAASSPGPQEDALARLKQFRTLGARIGTIHTERTPGQRGERAVRQVRDFQGLDFGLSANEPPGPRSSVAEMTDPRKLAMLRGLGIFSGVGAFVLHNANGVTGSVDERHNRGGDLWTVPDIDTIHAVVRGVDAILPLGVETWGKSTQHGGFAHPETFGDFGQPMAADSIWSDGFPSGCDRCYGAVNGSDFVTMVSDVVDFVELRARGGCDVEVFDVARPTAPRRASLGAGETIRLEQRESSDFIVRGRFR